MVLLTGSTRLHHQSGYTDISYVVPVTSSLCRQPHLQHPSDADEDGRRALSVAGPRAGNALPADIRCALSLETFKKCLKSHLFSAAYEL